MIYKTNYRLGLEDVGKFNKITNKAILRILENAGGMQSEKIGYGLTNTEKTGLSWILLGWKVKVLKRALYNEVIEVRTWARDSNKVFTYRDYEMYNEKGELLVIATSKWTLINIFEGKIASLTPELISAYEGEEKSVFEERTIQKLKEPQTQISKIDYKILRSDMDINEHVHNLYYLDFAYEALPLEIYKAEENNNIEIMYKKQIKYGEPITCIYTMEENQNIVTIKSQDDKTIHAIVKLY